MTDRSREETAVVRSMVLMSTLSTAADVVQAMAERRHGRDPSHQEEPDVAGEYLRRSCAELEELLIALRAALVLTAREDLSRTVVLARRANELMLLSRASRLLHLIHQRLLSLYPAVSEELVEEARFLESECAAILDGSSRSIAPFIEKSYAMTLSVRAGTPSVR